MSPVAVPELHENKAKKFEKKYLYSYIIIYKLLKHTLILNVNKKPYQIKIAQVQFCNTKDTYQYSK